MVLPALWTPFVRCYLRKPGGPVGREPVLPKADAGSGSGAFSEQQPRSPAHPQSAGIWAWRPAPGGFLTPAPCWGHFIRHKGACPATNSFTRAAGLLCGLRTQRPSGEQSSQQGGARGCL